MAKVSAVILIYDIRGFTAASKKIATGDLGAFATAAHKTILELFAERPPTFVKNLGDGHLLIWETTDDPEKALVGYVVAAAEKARAAFPAFVAGQKITGVELPKRVGIGVAVGDVSRSDDYYGVAVNLAARLQNLARPEGLAMDHTVFGMIGKREELIRQGFRKTKVSLKGLGTTLVWVNRPFSWERLWWTVGKYVGFAMIPICLLMLSDFDRNRILPWSGWVQKWIDRYELSISRRISSDSQIRSVADRDRRAIADSLLKARVEHGHIAPDLRDFAAMEGDYWSTSQAITGLLSTPHLDMETRRKLVETFDHAFAPGQFIEHYGWLAHADGSYTEAEPACWTVAALAKALSIPGLLEGERRKTFQEYLFKAQSALTEGYRPLETGGWNIFPSQSNPAYYSPYSTTLALLALLETKAAGEPWQGSMEKRDALLSSTAKFLISLFEEKLGVWGWRRTADKAEPLSEGLTMQIYAELLRAEKEAGIVLPESMHREIPAHLARLIERNDESAYDAGEFSVRFKNHEGKEDKRNEAINFLWHPWAIDAAVRWLASPAAARANREDIVRARRALAHLVVELSDIKRKDAQSGMSFVAGEALYGLSAVPPP
jgi:class 3 adenylate cyclase